MARSRAEEALAAALLLLLLAAAGARATSYVQGGPPSGADDDCPALCVCRAWLLLPQASCTGQRLYSIHTGVSPVVQFLDLSNNTIGVLEDRQLSRAGLTRLKFLNLSMNAINEIGMNAFEDLKNLSVLDLSMNRIDYIVPDTFYYNKNLRILHLAGNKFNLHVPKLHSTSITELDLSGCRIDRLMKDNFSGLSVLRKLDLSNNMLFELDKEVLHVLPFLKNLSLRRNQWPCNGITINMLAYLRHRKIMTDPVCAKLEKIIALQSLEVEPESEKPIPVLAETPPRSGPDQWKMDSFREIEEMARTRNPANGPKDDDDDEGDDNDDDDRPESRILGETLGSVSPLWFLLTGFLLGSGATMVVTYLWLSTTISCLIPRIRRAEAAETTDASSQRVSLLRHLWQQENMGSTEDSSGNNPTTATTTVYLAGSMTPSCPGTPPPPYREVMLHRNLYPRAAIAGAAQQQTPSGRQQLYVGVANSDSSAPTSYNI